LNATDSQHVIQLVGRWRERRSWAERLLKERLGLTDLLGIFALGRAVERDVPGTDWRYQTHGIGVSIHRPPEQTGGIDFDLNAPHPDAWRLREFARRQVDDGELAPAVYEGVFSDLLRLEPALAEVLDSEHAA
jgi:hypothetical protein